MNRTRRLVITADDYGFTAGINQGIESCVASGSVKATCVMANMPHWQAAVRLASLFPETSIGIHWTVTQGSPVLPADQVSSLVGADGAFLSPLEFRRRLRHGAIKLNQLRAELVAQYARLQAARLPVAFWNTHQNVHVGLSLYGFFVGVAQQLAIPAMRNHRRILIRGGAGSLCYYLRSPVFGAKGVVLAALALAARSRGMRMPLGLIADPEFGPGHARVLEALAGSQWRGIAELAIHPAADLVGLAGRSKLLATRLAECETFSQPQFPERLAGLGIELVSFAAMER